MEGRADGRQQVTYRDDIVAFAKADPKFCSLVERTFAEWVRVLVFSHVQFKVFVI